jgi:hypothetical protein
MISKAFGLPGDHLSTITMVRADADRRSGYPDAVTAAAYPDRLPAGNAGWSRWRCEAAHEKRTKTPTT